jgi:hypothetical protein
MMEFLAWCQSTELSRWVLSAKWRYPAIEILHIAGLVLVFGSILVLNLRIFGRILRQQPVSDVAVSLSPIALVGIAAQFISGPVLFMATAKHFYESVPFRVKLLLLAVALVYHFGVHRSLAIKTSMVTRELRISAVASMLLWSGVILAGFGIELLAGS